MTNLKNPITVSTVVDSNTVTSWEYYTNPNHITGWNFASNDWCCPRASNDLQKGGGFAYRMEAKDKSFGFDFEGYFTQVVPRSLLCYTIGNPKKPNDPTDRKVEVKLEIISTSETKVVVQFEPEKTNTKELQQSGWQSILDNYKHYCQCTSTTKIIVQSGLENTWSAITQNMTNYMKNMSVVSDWSTGSPVVFTCYNEDKSVMMWNDMPMIWQGVIKVFDPSCRLVIGYDGSGGLQRETYQLNLVDKTVAEVVFIQTAQSAQISKKYQKGNLHTLQLLKDYLESK